MHDPTETIVTGRLASYGAALKAIGAIDKREVGRWLNNRIENSHQPFRRRERAMLRFRRMRTEGLRSEVCRNSPRFTARSTTTSTRNVTFHLGQHSRNATPPLSMNGVNFARPDPCRGRVLSETFLFSLTAPFPQPLVWASCCRSGFQAQTKAAKRPYEPP
ncbi:MAG: DDE-type integrase/transposase/recombinase [Beijerinckiaceae bacterium]|nr:DDE-type integrase/transposase/recombinase [Beijerinckiaceae bacterium]